MMEDLRKLAEKYKSALESIKEVKSQLTSVVIKYLLLNSHQLKKCTELAISENLGIPRGVIRKVLLELSAEPVLRCVDLGTIKPYVVESIGYAIDRGYISFSRDELQEILSVKEPSEPIRDLVADAAVHGGRRLLSPGAAKCYFTLVGRFYSYLPTAEINEKLRKAYTPKTLEELDLLLPELSAFSKVTRFHAMVSPWTLGEPLLLGKDASSKEIRESIKRRWEQEIGYVLNRLETFAGYLEKYGYKGTIEKLGEPKIQIDYIGGPDYPPIISKRLREEYIWATTMALRNGCKIAEKLGVEEKLIERALLLSEVLDEAVEKGYRGKEKEGPLEEWYKRIHSSVD